MTSRLNFILFAFILFASATGAMADVKIKSRQTVAGQTSEGTTYIKGKRQRTERSLGQSGQMVSITQCDLRRSYELNPQTKMFVLASWENDASVPNAVSTSGRTTTEVRNGGTVTVTTTTRDTGETRQMFGYTARHLVITTEIKSSADACSRSDSKMVTDGWYIDAEFAIDCDAARYGSMRAGAAGGCRDRYEFKTAGAARRGYPVIEKMTMYDGTGRESMTMVSEVVELSKATLDAALFEVPSDYREARDTAELYTPTVNTLPTNGVASVRSPETRNPATRAETERPVTAAKAEGVIRIGVVAVKTGSVGEGLNAAELAGAVRGSLGEFLKGTKIELVDIEARLESAIETEAREKECDFVLIATVSHKRGGGGFGMFSKIAPVLGNVASVGGVTGSRAGQVATTSVYSASNIASGVKPKDEMTLDINLRKGTTPALGRQFKSKAKSAGDDLVSAVAEQAAAAIVAAVGP